MYICIVRGEKRWAKAHSDKRTVGTPGCHLGWTEAAICQQPPDFLCLQAWEASIGQTSPLTKYPSWALEMEIARVYPFWPIMPDSEKPIMWHFTLGSFHSGIEQRKNFKKSVDFLATENVCCKYFSKSNEPRCIGCLTAVWCRWPGKFKDTLLSFLENKHHKIDPLPLFMNRERKHLANLLETHLINTHFPLYSTHQDFKMKISPSGWISW